MTTSLHHVVFAVTAERRAEVAQMFTDLGFSFNPAHLDRNGDSGYPIVPPEFD